MLPNEFTWHFHRWGGQGAHTRKKDWDPRNRGDPRKTPNPSVGCNGHCNRYCNQHHPCQQPQGKIHEPRVTEIMQRSIRHTRQAHPPPHPEGGQRGPKNSSLSLASLLPPPATPFHPWQQIIPPQINSICITFKSFQIKFQIHCPETQGSQHGNPELRQGWSLPARHSADLVPHFSQTNFDIFTSLHHLIVPPFLSTTFHLHCATISFACAITASPLFPLIPQTIFLVWFKWMILFELTWPIITFKFCCHSDQTLLYFPLYDCDTFLLYVLFFHLFSFLVFSLLFVVIFIGPRSLCNFLCFSTILLF